MIFDTFRFMKWLSPFFLFLPGLCCSQHSLIHDVPDSQEVLAKNKVSKIQVFEKTNGNKKLTNEYFIDENGTAVKHLYHDFYSNDSLPVVETSEVIAYSPKTVKYVRARMNAKGNIDKVYQESLNYYTHSNKIMRVEYKEHIDLIKSITHNYDTADYEKVDKVEIVSVSTGDTLRRITDFYDKTIKVHRLEIKTDGKWIEKEKSVSDYRDGELSYHSFYQNGKLVSTYDPNEKRPDEPLGDDTYKDQMEYGLPVPEPFIDSFYTNEKTKDKSKSITENKALYKVVLRYEGGKGHDLSYYRVYDRKKGLLLLESDPNGNYPKEYVYKFN